MSILGLANELFLDIFDYLRTQRDSRSFALVNRRLYVLFIDRLYIYNIQFKGGKALLWAARKGYDRVVRKFLHHGANIEMRSHTSIPYLLGAIPSFSSSSMNRDSVYGLSPLHFAAHNGHLDVLQTLLIAGAAVNARNSKYECPITMALIARQEHCAITMLACVTDISSYTVGKHMGLGLLHLSSRLGLVAVVKYLLHRGIYVDATDNMGLTALHHVLISRCCGSGDSQYINDPAFKVVNLFLDHGASLKPAAANFLPKYGGGPFVTISGLVRCHPNPRIHMLFNEYNITSQEQSEMAKFMQALDVAWSVASLKELSCLYKSTRAVTKRVVEVQAVPIVSSQRLGAQSSMSGKIPNGNPLDLVHFPALSLSDTGGMAAMTSTNHFMTNMKWSQAARRGKAAASNALTSLNVPLPPKEPVEEFPALNTKSSAMLHVVSTDTRNWASLLANKPSNPSTRPPKSNIESDDIEKAAPASPNRKARKESKSRKFVKLNL